MMSPTIKLSSPATREFWEMPVLFEDADLLALDKPAGLATEPEAHLTESPSLVQLLHESIASGRRWSAERGLTFLRNVNRLDADGSGVVLFARNKAVWGKLADAFGGAKAVRQYRVLAHGACEQDAFSIDAKLAPDSLRPGLMRIDRRRGKRSQTKMEVLERFSGYVLLSCTAITDRPGQIRLHVRHAGLAVVGDGLYRGRPLYLSELKPNYRAKSLQPERPLISRAAVHAERISLLHPVTGADLTITSPEPKDFRVALKYLRQFALVRLP